MAVTFFNATSTSAAASAGARTVTLIGTAGAALLVWSYGVNTAVSLSAMACGTNPMSRLGLVTAGGCVGELWALSSCPTGTLTISAIPVGVATTRWCMAAATYIGQRTVGGSPFGTFVGGSATGTTVNFSVSSTTTDVVAFGWGISANTTLVLGNGNTRASATASTGGRLVVGDITGAPTISASASAGASSVFAFMGVPIVASATAPTTSIVFDNAAFSGVNASVNTFGLKLTATTNAVLMVFINCATQVGGNTISAVNAGATQLSFLTAVDGHSRQELWALTAPPSGILTISAICVGTNTVAWNMAAVTYIGHRTSATPFGGAAVVSGTGVNNINISVSSTAGNVVVMSFGSWMFDPVSVSTGSAFVLRAASDTWPCNHVVDTIGAPSVTGSAQASSAVDWTVIGINLIQAGPNTNRSGIAAMTDAPDTFSLSSNVRVTGSLVKTDAPDTFAAPTGVRVRGPFAATDAADSFSASGGARVRGSLVNTDAPDTFATSANIRVTGSFIKTDAQDAFAASGNIRVVGSLTKTDTVDAFIGTAGVRVTVALAASDIADTFTAVGVTTNNRTGSLIATDAPDIFSASGIARVTGLLAATDIADSFSLSGAVRVTTLLAATDTRDSFSASANPIPAFLTAALSATDAPDTFLAITPITVLPSANLSYGGSGGKKGKSKPPYIQLDSDWWDARERYLLSLQPDMVEPQIESAHETTITPDISRATVSPQFLIDYRAERRAVIQAIPLAENMKVLRVAGERLRAINQKIIEQERIQAAELSFKRAEAALVRADTAERRALRQQQIKRKRIAIATLEVARQVVRLYGNHHL